MPKTRNLLTALTILAVTGCTSHPTAPAAPAAATARGTSASPGSEHDTRVAAALSTYGHMWIAYVTAVKHPDPTDPTIRRFADLNALSVLQGNLYFFQSRGLSVSGTFTFNPTVTLTKPPSAPTWVAISDCLDTSMVHATKTDGSAYRDPKGGPHPVNAVVEYHDGSWMVTTLTIGAVGTC